MESSFNLKARRWLGFIIFAISLPVRLLHVYTSMLLPPTFIALAFLTPFSRLTGRFRVMKPFRK